MGSPIPIGPGDRQVLRRTTARRLDPTVPTSVEYAYLQTSDSEHLWPMLGPDTGGKERDALLVLLSLLGNEPRLRDLADRIDREQLPGV